MTIFYVGVLKSSTNPVKNFKASNSNLVLCKRFPVETTIFNSHWYEESVHFSDDVLAIPNLNLSEINKQLLTLTPVTKTLLRQFSAVSCVQR